MYLFVVQSLCIASIYALHRGATVTDVDEFIDSLVSSRKFDILVEKIADRAVEKIKSHQRQGDSTKRGDKSGKEIPKRGESKQLPEYHLNVLRKEEANKKFKTAKVQQNARGSGKIDNQAVKEKFRAIPFDKLSLKYKSFTNTKSQDSSKPTKPALEHELQNKFSDQNKFNEQPEKPEKHEYRSIEFNLKSEESKTLSHFDVSEERPKNTNDNLSPIIIKDETETPPNKSDSAEITSNAPAYKYSDIYFNFQDQASQRTQDKENINLRASNEVNDIMPESLNNLQANEKVTPLKANEGNQTNDVNSNESEEYEDDKVSLSPAVDHEATTAEVYNKTALRTEKSNVIRREGDKYFTFVNSPDYDEYHEKFDKEYKKVD